MNNLRRIILFITLIVFSFALLYGSVRQQQVITENVQVCYLLTDNGYFESVKLPVESENDLALIFEKLVEGDANRQLEGVIPSGLQINAYSLKDGLLEVRFNNGFYTLETTSKRQLITSVVKSFTSYPMVNRVKLQIPDYISGELSGYINTELTGEDIFVTMDDMFSETSKHVDIYIPDKEQRYLVVEEVEILIDPTVRIEETLIDVLMSYVDDLFPIGSDLLSVYTNKNVCYIDFNEAFIREPLPEQLPPEILIYSIVNSLVEFQQITRVQFLIEGKIESSFHGVSNFDELFSKNFVIIKQN